MLVMSRPMELTRKYGRGQTNQDSTSLKRSPSIAKKLFKSKMARKTVALNSMRGNHNMPPKCNMRIIKLIIITSNSMNNRKSEDQLAADKTNMKEKILEQILILEKLEKETIVVYNRRIQGDIKAKTRCKTL